MQLGDETDAFGKFLRGPPVALFAFCWETLCKRAWPRAAQDLKVLEPFLFSSDSFWCWARVSRGSAALPPPCVLPVHVRGSAARLVLPAFSSGSVLPAPRAFLPPVLFFPGSAAFLPPCRRLCGPSPAASTSRTRRTSGSHG